MPFSTTNKAAYQQQEQLTTSTWPEKLTMSNTNYHWLWWVQHILTY